MAFRIEGLHGRRTIEIPIEDGKLILVGENGTGKSTVASILFFFLSGQWHRLEDYEFDSVSGVFEPSVITITHDQLRSDHPARGQHRRHFSPRLWTSFVQHFRSSDIEEVLGNRDKVLEMAESLDMPASMVEQMIVEMLETTPEARLELVNRANQLRDLLEAQVLFLPTYRRIEQDMRSIFRGHEREIGAIRKRLRRRTRIGSYIELVEFGMGDVKQAFEDRMAQIKDEARNGLNNLTGAYLRDVIRGEHEDVSFKGIESVFDADINAILDRLDESILPEGDKEHLLHVIDDIRAAEEIGESEKVAAHFLSKLVELQDEQKENEREVREFVRVCNDYLVGKYIEYDDHNYRIVVQGAFGNQEIEDEIELSMLSSGEKQIVSLFSHIYLSSVPQFFVIIDEPELSLSVPWQKRFLPDILASRRCDSLVAVTHSPFIFDNALDAHVHSLAEFWEAS
jgi:predicted ATPase